MQRRKESQHKWLIANPEKMKECRKQWVKANPEKVREINRRYGQTEKRKEYCKLWKQNNREHINKQAREYYWKNPEKYKESTRKYILAHPKPIKFKIIGAKISNEERRKRKNEYVKLWREKNIEKAREKDLKTRQKRKFLKWKNGGNYTIGEWDLLRKQYGFICPMCNRKEPEIKLTADHIIPLSKGGSSWIENIQPLCVNCNSKKHTKIFKVPLKIN